MLVVGVGIGLVMQVLVLVVQNDAPARSIGVATSTATFFRSMGGSLGVAVFGAIFAARLAHELAAIPGAGGLSGGANIRPDQVHALPPAVRHDFLLAFVDALQPVFLVGAGITSVAFILAWMLKEKPLRETTQASAEESVAVVAPSPSSRDDAGRLHRRPRGAAPRATSSASTTSSARRSRISSRTSTAACSATGASTTATRRGARATRR